MRWAGRFWLHLQGRDSLLRISVFSIWTLNLLRRKGWKRDRNLYWWVWMGADGKDSKKQGNSSSSGSPQGDLLMRGSLLLCFHVTHFLSIFKRALLNRCKQLFGCGAKLVRILDVIQPNHQRCLMWICIRFSTLFMCLVVYEVVWCLIIGCRILDLDRSIKLSICNCVG